MMMMQQRQMMHRQQQQQQQMAMQGGFMPQRQPSIEKEGGTGFDFMAGGGGDNATPGLGGTNNKGSFDFVKGELGKEKRG